MLRPRIKQLRPSAAPVRTSVRTQEPPECECNGAAVAEHDQHGDEEQSFIPRVLCAGLFGAAAGLCVVAYRAPEQEAIAREE